MHGGARAVAVGLIGWYRLGCVMRGKEVSPKQRWWGCSDIVEQGLLLVLMGCRSPTGAQDAGAVPAVTGLAQRGLPAQ